MDKVIFLVFWKEGGGFNYGLLYLFIIILIFLNIIIIIIIIIILVAF